tara:strand:- start:36 stop:1568 length:1533 start_codon:yes stop_codon:yes gene_type:complete
MPISKPSVTLNIIPAEQLAKVSAHRVLIVGQLLAGTATGGEMQADVDDATNAINAQFGARSQVAEMVREFKKINKITPLDVLPLADNGAAVDATANVAFSGTATAAGSLIVTFGSDKRYDTKIDISIGDTATAVGAAVETAFALYTSSPFTVAAATGTATATASNGGTHANDWTVRVQGAVAGITYVVTGWASGATDPSLTGVLDVLGSTRYHTVVWPAAYDISVIEDVLNARFNATNNVLDGVAIQVKKGTLSSLKSYVAALNSQSLSIIGDKTVNATARKGTSLREMPDVTATQAGAIRALRLTTGANLTQYLTTTAALDQFGGVALASLPYFNTALPSLPVPLAEDEFTFEDQDELNSNAIALISANRAFNTTIFGDVVTTYLTDNAGNADTSYKFLNTVDTASVIRETFFVNYKDRYAQTRLTNGDLIAGRDMANEASIRAFSLEVYRSLAVSGLTQAGSTAEQDFLDNLLISLDLATGTATINMAPLFVTQLRSIIGTIQVNFGG